LSLPYLRPAAYKFWKEINRDKATAQSLITTRTFIPWNRGRSFRKRGGLGFDTDALADDEIDGAVTVSHHFEARSTSEVVVGDITLDPAARRVRMGEDELTLRPKEFDLLARLMADAGHAVTRETLMTDVWDEHWFGSTKTLDFHVAALRRKIDEPGALSRITTLRGVGYRYELS